MKLTESMLRDYVETPLTVEQIGDLLTMTGFELEEITEVEGEPVLDVNIMANRGDGASVIGLAREVLAKDSQAKPTELMTRAVTRFEAPDIGTRDVWSKAAVVVQTDHCTRFAARVFEGLNNGSSPEWLQERLTQIGQRPISLLVDLTNYVMFETGQPLHAYDLDKLAGAKITVRQALDGESLRTLDGKDHDLMPRNMLICDDSGAIGIAGVMGGESTEVSASTTRCLLESAHFRNTSVRKTRKDVGLHTEASYRFERHVDPEGVVAALNRFAELLQQCGGPRPVGGVIDIRKSMAEPTQIHARMDRSDRILGMEVDPTLAISYLEKLGFEVVPVGPRKFDVTAPSWRIDVVREDDVIEEIGRVHGYEKIPEHNLRGSTGVGGFHGLEALVEDLTAALLKLGFDEMVSHSLGDTHPLDHNDNHLQVLQPHSPDMARLRNSLLPGLARAAAKNGGRNFARFESGRVFESAADEHRHIAALAQGAKKNPSWQSNDGLNMDFFGLKGVLEAALATVHRTLILEKSKDKRFHPGRQAFVLVGSTNIGLIGELHPDLCKASDLPEGTVGFELNVRHVFAAPQSTPAFKSLSKNPAVRRDVSLTFPDTLTFAEIDKALQRAEIKDIETYWLFDIYSGKGVEDGHRSLSFAMSIRRAGTNFTDEEANLVRDSFVAVLTGLGAQVRS